MVALRRAARSKEVVFMLSISAAKIGFATRLTLAAAAVAAVLVALPAQADTIAVSVDRAKVMRISRPADVVIVGNPAIADATVQDNQTLIITGKSFGTTNLIVLDAMGQSIADSIVTVTQPDDGLVTVYRRASRQTLSCTPDCSPTLAIGDNSSAFDAVNSQISAHGSSSAPK
jgi:Flp pilus assembly secretin CpaC